SKLRIGRHLSVPFQYSIDAPANHPGVLRELLLQIDAAIRPRCTDQEMCLVNFCFHFPTGAPAKFLKPSWNGDCGDLAVAFFDPAGIFEIGLTDRRSKKALTYLIGGSRRLGSEKTQVLVRNRLND